MSKATNFERSRLEIDVVPFYDGFSCLALRMTVNRLVWYMQLLPFVTKKIHVLPYGKFSSFLDDKRGWGSATCTLPVYEMMTV